MNDNEARILSRLKLRTYPFAPHVGLDGAPFQQDPAVSPLNPGEDKRLLDYYFDLYDWKTGTLFNGLSRQTGLKKFPESYELRPDEPLLVLVSGAGTKTGRGSLINLIIYTIKLKRQRDPVVIKVKFNSYNKQQNVKDLARQFIPTYCAKLNLAEKKKKQLEEQLFAVYEREKTEAGSSNDAYYPTMFTAMRSKIEEFVPNRPPVLFLLSGADNYDLWSCIYNSTQDLANYLIVDTGKTVDAETCYKQMARNSRNIAHINAALLDKDTARRYIVDRLNFERTEDFVHGQDNELFPFSEEAINVLFQPGAGGQDVRYPIGWLIATVRRAFQAHMENLVQTGAATTANQGAAAPVLPSMGKQHMWDVRQTMNQGN